MILMALPSFSIASPQPALVSDAYTHLMPLHTLFLRQLSDLQTFTGQLGDIPASPITNSGNPERPFEVEGETFDQFSQAGQRSCDRQQNKCAEQANAQGNSGGFEVGDCDKQKEECNRAQDGAPVKDFATGLASQNIGPDPEFPDFDLICDA
ncbi:hypothetical protein CC78DRAFT_577906 [Lojkania enalia]|uniref:Uncharacterized protein n=1 Tax=Lojkania enalia TaxID=147567 RepID=A0A9P4KDC8_9PLEO|nr:hypothetical protein CC78DRAFT_577906 [Didymosphaeria enalia]